MTNPEEPNQTKETPGWLHRIIPNLGQQSQWMEDFKKYCEMDHPTLETSLSDRIPVPPKDKPFTDELPNLVTNPLATEMMETTECLNLVEIVARIKALLIALLAALALWLFQGNILTWIFLGIGVVLDQFLITMLLKAGTRKFMANYHYVKILSYRYHDPAIDHQTFWNLERLKKWAVARYDITSTETFMTIMGEGRYEAEGEMVKSGPMKGLLVSAATGQEWTLRPELQETE